MKIACRAILSFVFVLFVSFALPVACFASPRLVVATPHPILPVAAGVTGTVSVVLEAPEPARYRAIAVASSGLGALVLPGGGSEFFIEAGKPVEIGYRWSGPVPTEAPHRETVTVQIPELGLKGEASFSVGMNLCVTGAVFRGEAPVAGEFYGAEFILIDTFHPDADLPALMRGLGLSPELKIELIPEGAVKPVVTVVDPVVKKFLGNVGGGAKEFIWPSRYEPGEVTRNEATNDAVWTSASGRKSGFTAPGAGKYQLKAYLVPKTGIGVREYAVDLEVGGAAQSGYTGDRNDAVGSTLRILDAQGVTIGEQTPPALGAAMAETFKASKLHTLGRYAEALTASDDDVKNIAAYLRDFLSGYKGYGVLLFTRSGVGEWKASTSGGVFSAAPDSLRGAGNSRARVFTGNRVVAIPFALGDKFTLHLSGSNKGAATLWKIMPQGINSTTYPQGDWEKEITVYTDRIAPPKP